MIVRYYRSRPHFERSSEKSTKNNKITIKPITTRNGRIKCCYLHQGRQRLVISRIMLPDFINFAVLNLAIVARQFVEMTRIRIEVNQFGLEV